MVRRHAVDGHPMFHAPIDGTWYWMRSPDEEKSAAAGLFNRYCIRCHGVDGRGVWDIPGIPNFTNVRWQASRSDDQLARAIMQGRGAVMPTFRGALALEEAWALARHVRTFIPGSEVSRPDEGEPDKGKGKGKGKGKEATKKPDAAGSEPAAKDAPTPKGKKPTKKPDAAAPEPAAKDAPSPKGKKATKKPDAAAPEPAGEEAPTPKGKKPTKKSDAAAPEPAGEEVPSPQGKAATKKPDAAAPEPAADEAPAPKGKKAKKKPDAAASDEAPAPKADNVPTLKPPR
ncbi:MAG TPA: cytochrome c [Pirellulales bacterium]|nr:cytochrome c [Pirellulales bacterium]